MIGIVCHICRSPKSALSLAMRLASAAIGDDSSDDDDDDVVLRPSTWLGTAQFNEPAEVFLISPTAVCQQKKAERQKAQRMKNIAQYPVMCAMLLVASPY